VNGWWGIFWLVVLLAGNAFFVAAEFAVLAARRAQVEPLAEAGNPAARVALWAMEHASLMLACSQLGITVCSLLILNVSEPSIHRLVEGPLHALGLSESLTSGVSFALALVLVTFLHVTLGEMVPKNIAFSRPGPSVLLLGPALAGVARVTRPAITALDRTANWFVRRLGVEPRGEATAAFTLDQVATIVAESERAGLFRDVSGTVTKAFEFTAKRASDLAVPLRSLVTLPRRVTPREVEEAVGRHGHSRYVLVDERGEMVGYVHFKDVIALPDSSVDAPLPERSVRRLAAVPGVSEAEEVLAFMRSSGSHLAVVRGAAGEVLGVLFLEDIVEELIGEVRDISSRRAAEV
jgi:CBS domain containing-hemolysin-like protein